MRSSVSEKMNIPKKINVGFVNREDTYTKKLAYVIYTDEKGKLRKQASWDSWRNKNIKPLEFDNEPMSGFVLNKKVGGHKSGWNHRNAYVRIYDPRDFEFEISVENLLFILQETSAIKGKGLEGEFVYAWHGKDLVLLPVDTEEYKACVEFTSKKTKKVTKAEIKEGHSYLMKDMTNVMYLGKLPYSNTWGWGKTVQYVPVGKHHIFVNLDASRGQDIYISLNGFTKLAEVTSTDTSSFANKLTAYKRSPFHRIATGIQFSPKKLKFSDFTDAADGYQGTYSNYVYCLTKTEDNKYLATVLYRSLERSEYDYEKKRHKEQKVVFKSWIGPALEFKFDGIDCEVPRFDIWSLRKPYNMWNTSGSDGSTILTEKEVFSNKYYTVELISNKGADDILVGGFRPRHY